ncbi:RND family efflux transporter MFP subunit [Candidatus Nitrosoglobus terrae]|uniref:RND family efflux transporter MFP subunit n=1 Tax=Candidatus Nitrosoglobus terrae TaxID=1630141 RepID=A0A1Q2SN08_9GAMM|nr:efflux RND transporter periplasmic adaptor subunit [Candidatus Nitrosoglobus terrae]BAW80535.1 RND family efflux transporter MFP subunit [Candidatus Nitrosoglobus terrae]
MEALEKLKIHRVPKTTPQQVPKPNRRWIRVFISLLIGVITLYFIYTKILRSGTQIIVGTISLAYPAQEYTLFNATGYVVPQTKADIASKATGQLEALEVEEGDYVKKGDVIARLENRDVLATMAKAKANIAITQAGLLEAKAELENAAITLKRLKSLVNRNLATQADYDIAKARYDTAEAKVQSARANILVAEAGYQEAKVAVEYTLIRAPFDGVILKKHADLGDVVAPFSSAMQSKGTVVSMADMNTLQVEVDVSESNLMQVKINQPCQIQLDAFPDNRIRGRVHMIIPTVDRAKATILVKVRFIDRDDRILPDMSARVAFLSQELSSQDLQPYIVAPISAIFLNNNQAYAFRIRNNIAYQTPVIIGEQWRDLVVIKSGLANGDKVAIHLSTKLRDGTQVIFSSTNN